MRKTNRLLAGLLSIIMVLSMLPISVLTVFATEGDDGYADVYIIGRDELIAHSVISLDEAQKLDVSKYTSSTSGGCTALHAIAATLKKANKLDSMQCSGGYIGAIGNLDAGSPNYMSGWMYKVNDVFPDVSVAMQMLKDGDKVILFWSEGMDGQIYTEFDKLSATVKTGETLSLSAKFAKLDMENGLGKEIEYTTIKDERAHLGLYINGEPYPANLTSMGSADTASVYFSKPGTYIITAKASNVNATSLDESNCHILTLPVCVVTVTGDELPQGGGLSKLEITLKDQVCPVELKEGQTEYYISAKGEFLTLKQNFTRDDAAAADNATVSMSYAIFPKGVAVRGLRYTRDITANENKTYSVPTFFVGPGNSIIQYVVHSEGKTDTIYTIHVFLDNTSPDAYLSGLTAKLNDGALVSSNTSDFTGGLNPTLKVYCQGDGDTYKEANANDLKEEHELTIYVPHESQKLKLTPTIPYNGTSVVTDVNGNEIPVTVESYDSYTVLEYGESDEAVYHINTTSSDKSGYDTYTLTVKRRPELTIEGAEIENGRLWNPGIIPGYGSFQLYIPKEYQSDEVIAKLKIPDGAKLYLNSVSEENLVTDGIIKSDLSVISFASHNVILSKELENGEIYTVTYDVQVGLENNFIGMELLEHLTTPSQHMSNLPVDTQSGSSMLSTFGGYDIYRLNKPLKNDPSNIYGIDFVVQGNPQFPNVWSFSEPAQVYVAQDKDGDGEPDQWYALAGSEHYEDDTLWDYEITYTDEGNRKVRWEDNYGGDGYVCGLSTGCEFPDAKIQKINSIYRPEYEEGKLTVSGILIGPVKAQSTIYAPPSIFGYGDCMPGGYSETIANPYRDPGIEEIDSSLSEEDQMKQMIDKYGETASADGMDISWAVDENGNPVYLDEISFIKTMSAVNVDSGIFSEKSPEIGNIKLINQTDNAQAVGISALPDSITINGRELDLSGITADHGLANLTVYLENGETSADVKVDAGERNVILGNRRCTERTFDVDADGRIFRIITQDGDKEPNILVITVKHTDEAVAKAISNIIEIGDVSIASGDAISSARMAYDALTEEQKALVTNYSVLVEAEKLYAELVKASNEKFDTIYQSVGDYMMSLGTPSVGSVGGEWMVIGLARSGRSVPSGYYDAVVKYVKENINDKEQLHRSKSTDNSRIILALTALGYDVTDIDGHNLLMGLSDMSYIKKQGINGPIWALIAFDSHNYEIPFGDVTRDALVAAILDEQLSDGGWALSGNDADPDMTAMAIQALAPYYVTDAKVKSAVDNALNRLSDMQTSSGGYLSWGTLNSESCAQVIAALTALGIDPQTDSRFIKNGCSVLDALMAFYTDGGFRHTMDGELNGMATEQGYYALVSYARLKENKTSLYDMSDVTVHMGENPDIPDDPNKKPDDNNQDDQPPKPDDNNQGDQSTKPDDSNQGDTVPRPNGGSTVQSPQTGDSTNVIVYFGLMILSLAGLTVTTASKLRKKHD